jgi:alpha-1,3-mannosyltransferase
MPQHAYAHAHKIWAWRIVMAGLCLSKRLHSIYLLRLFNDGPTMLLLYTAVLLFMRQRWNGGCLLFSLAVSLKMNVLLFAPGLLLLLVQTGPTLGTVVKRLAFGCALPQLLLGAPFLLRHPVSYLRKAFELDRAFFYEWTVNWKCLPEALFLSNAWARLLLLGHLGSLAYLAVVWLRRTRLEQAQQRALFRSPQQPLSPLYIAHTLFVSNFIGIAFARTLHYQFYVRTPIHV